MKGWLVNTVTVSFNTIMGQTTTCFIEKMPIYNSFY